MDVIFSDHYGECLVCEAIIAAAALEAGEYLVTPAGDQLCSDPCADRYEADPDSFEKEI